MRPFFKEIQRAYFHLLHQKHSVQLQNQAWKAMINTPVEDVSSLIEKVIIANTEEAWASLWF
ncbi:MAG: hypothetical protein BalsKO_20640 [Balneolaceae bacterium]